MPSYQINIWWDEIFIENELSHNGLKPLHLSLANVGDPPQVRVKAVVLQQPARYQLGHTLLIHGNMATSPPASRGMN